MRKAMSGTGPKPGAEMRMNKKEAPQIAARKRRMKKSAIRTIMESDVGGTLSRGS
jgi:hypothetical protein